MSVHPRLAAMLLTAERLNACELGCLLAALISEKDLFRESSVSSADLGLRLYALAERGMTYHFLILSLVPRRSGYELQSDSPGIFYDDLI